MAIGRTVLIDRNADSNDFSKYTFEIVIAIAEPKRNY